MANGANQAVAEAQGSVTGLVLEGVANLVGGYRYSREGAPPKMGFAQNHDPALRIVVIAGLPRFDPHPGDPEPLEEVFGKLSARPWDVGAIPTVAGHHGSHPELGPIENGRKCEESDHEVHSPLCLPSLIFRWDRHVFPSA